jgi:hypothetical protein
MVPVPPGGIADHQWSTTVDVRNPKAVALIGDLMTEVCQAFPGKFINVDVTEIADYGFVQSGTKAEELPSLMLGYTTKLRDMVAKHHMRLMINQCRLDVGGHLNGVGPVLDKLPKDIVVASYYTAGFYGGWEKDFPRLQQKGIGFFAQPWIDSHGHIMPYVGHAMDFSDLTISRGHRFGALGSISDDWGDDGHYHLPGVTWYPFLYHCASAWTEAKLDRGYFDQAFCRLVFGAKDDSIARAIVLAGAINGQKIRIRNAAGGVDEPAYEGNGRFGRYYYELFADPFVDATILDIVDPGQKGREILEPAKQAASILAASQKTATRNRDVLNELLFAAKNYRAMGRKIVIREHYLDSKTPRSQVAAELLDLAKTYESLRSDFKRLWLAECKDAGSFQGYLRRYDNTILPCNKKAEELGNH